MNQLTTPSVLFVCVKNGDKSHGAAGLMRKIAGGVVQAYSAATKPGTTVNDLAARVLGEVGIDITGQTPLLVDSQLVRDVDIVVTLLAFGGTESHPCHCCVDRSEVGDRHSDAMLGEFHPQSAPEHLDGDLARRVGDAAGSIAPNSRFGG
jgi:hypothetical protein